MYLLPVCIASVLTGRSVLVRLDELSQYPLECEHYCDSPFWIWPGAGVPFDHELPH